MFVASVNFLMSEEACDRGASLPAALTLLPGVGPLVLSPVAALNEGLPALLTGTGLVACVDSPMLEEG